jgi:integrase
MRGHLQQRGPDSWRLKVFIGRGADGKRHYVERTVRGTKRKAEQELARLVVEAGEGRYSPTAPMSLNQLLDRWLNVKRMAVEPATMSNYRWISDAYIRPALGDRKVAALRPIELDMLYADLHGRGLSARTVRICHTVLRQSLEQARRWGLIARSPAVDATPPRQTRKEVVAPTVDEVRLLLGVGPKNPPNDPPNNHPNPNDSQAFATYLWVLAATGCRRGEGCALRWNDIDFQAGTLTIRRSIAMAEGVPYEKSTKTHQSRRVALDEATLARLRVHRRRMRELALELGTKLLDDAHVFADVEGRPWRPDVCTNRFGRLRADLGLSHVRLHDLRHFVATVLGDGGVPIATISDRLGHRDTATTLNIYTHALPATDQVAASYLGAILAGSPPAAQH